MYNFRIQEKRKQPVLEKETPLNNARRSHSRMTEENPGAMKRSMAHQREERDFHQARLARNLQQNNGGKFPLPKDPKVEIHVFKGEGDVLNWLCQLKHIFNIHNTPVENRVDFCVFYVQGEALLWRRWLGKQKRGFVSWPDFYDEIL